MKYMYVLYVTWTEKASELGQEGFKKWLKENEKICKEAGVNLVWGGIPYTTVETSALFYDTDMPLDEFHLFKAKIFEIMGGGYIGYGNTHMFLTWPWNL